MEPEGLTIEDILQEDTNESIGAFQETEFVDLGVLRDEYEFVTGRVRSDCNAVGRLFLAQPFIDDNLTPYLVSHSKRIINSRKNNI